MKIDEYQTNAVSTAVYPKKYAIIYPTIGLAGEAGETADKLADLIVGKSKDAKETQENIILEIGDVMWYLATTSNDLGVSLSECLSISLGDHYDDFLDAQDQAVRITQYDVSYEVVYPVFKLFGAIGKVSELVKKYVRDDSEIMDDIRKHRICNAIGETFKYLSCVAFDLSIEMSWCAEKNIEKLFSRKERNVVHGDGDNR